MKYSDDSNYKSLIHSRKWTLLRNSYLINNPICEHCHEHLATEVHHVDILNRYRNDLDLMYNKAFDENNLMAVCHDCHIKLHIEAGKWNNYNPQAVNEEKVNNFLNNWIKDN